MGYTKGVMKGNEQLTRKCQREVTRQRTQKNNGGKGKKKTNENQAKIAQGSQAHQATQLTQD